jgi:hypothetical protein
VLGVMDRDGLVALRGSSYPDEDGIHTGSGRPWIADRSGNYPLYTVLDF